MSEVICDSYEELRKVRQLYKNKKIQESLRAAYSDLYQEYIVNGKISTDIDSLSADILNRGDR